MKSLFKKRLSLPGLAQAEKALKEFTIGERFVFYAIATLFVFFSLIIISKANDIFSVTIPVQGGALTEGMLGSPRFINPILAVSDADRDLSSLVFSGLLRPNPDGTLRNDLAEGYDISEDGLTYTVTIKKEAKFHDGTAITADDIIFTIEKAQDPSIKSPKRAEWESVRVEKISEQVVAFHLPRPYYPFVENLTLGIIPKNLWKDVNAEEFAFSLKNITPIGSGPYFIKTMIKNDKGIPTSYELGAFKDYPGHPPYIKKIIIKLFGSEKELVNAWKKGDVESLGGIAPGETVSLKKAGAQIAHFKLPRVYGIFLNQNQAPIFVDKAVRQALDMAIDKKDIVEKVLLGYGTALSGPLPEEIIFDKANLSLSKNENLESASSTASRIEMARKILTKAGWTLNEETNIFEKKEKATKSKPAKTTVLSFNLVAPNVTELKEAAAIVIEQWKKLGVRVELKLYEISDLNQNVIRPRKYDAVLFGEVVGRNPDLFAFWHSSQRNDPGYNIALYTNSKVDKMLDLSRQVKSQEEQRKIIENIFNEIKNDTPAIFLYTPDYLYVLPEKIQGFSIGVIASPAERFSDIVNWYIEKEKVWRILTQEK